METPWHSTKSRNHSLPHTFLKEIHDLLDIAIDNTTEARATHDQSLGRTTRKNQRMGDMYDEDISRLQNAYAQLKGIIE